MPFDPTKPATGSPLESQVIRDQLNALNDEIQAVPAGPPGPQGPPGEVTAAQLNTELTNLTVSLTSNLLAQSSNNSNGVSLLGLTVSDPVLPAEVQAIVSKLDELITALRR